MPTAPTHELGAGTATVFSLTRTPGHRDAVTRLVLQSDMLGMGHQHVAVPVRFPTMWPLPPHCQATPCLLIMRWLATPEPSPPLSPPTAALIRIASGRRAVALLPQAPTRARTPVEGPAMTPMLIRPLGRQGHRPRWVWALSAPLSRLGLPRSRAACPSASP